MEPSDHTITYSFRYYFATNNIDRFLFVYCDIDSLFTFCETSTYLFLSFNVVRLIYIFS